MIKVPYYPDNMEFLGSLKIGYGRFRIIITLQIKNIG